MAYIDTPRTDAGNATYLDHGKGIDDLSMEMSFLSPKKRKKDLVDQMRSKAQGGLRTPDTRQALLDRPNLSKKGAVEFTPLLKSATKNLARRGKENYHAPRTPGFLKTLHEAEEDGGLPVSESSVVMASDSDNTDMAMRSTAVNNLPNLNSSSIMSTPMLGNGKGDRVLEDQRNLMTLREQENIINKTEKENFGLKLKIHFLEEMLAKSDPNLNQEAIRQNTDLRVDRATLQRELNKVKKQLQNSDREAEKLRLQMLDDQAKMDQQVADKRLRKEMEVLRETVRTREEEIERLKYRVDGGNRTQEIENLKESIEDLEAEIREKDRVIDTREDERESVSDQQRRIRELQDELEEANERIDELKDLEASNRELADAVRQAKQDLADAEEGERRAEREIESAADNSKQQLEEAQANFQALREKYDLLKDGYKTKSASIQELENALFEAKAAARNREQDLIREHEATRNKQQELLSAKGPIEERLQDLLRQLHAKSDEKDLLQTRHDALTDESESLQRELSRARSESAQLQLEVNSERQRSMEIERSLKEESRTAQEKLVAENDRLHTSLDAERSRVDSVKDHWHAKARELQNENKLLEQKAFSLQQTVDKLHQSEGNLSTRESRLQASLEGERERSSTEKLALQQQIRDLQVDLNDQRTIAEKCRSEAASLKEDLRARMRDLANAVQKQEALEDEVVVLQSSVDESSDRVNQEVHKLKEELSIQRSQVSKKQAEISELTNELRSAESRLQSLREDIQTRSSRKHQANGRATELQTLVADLQLENRTISADLERSRIRVKELEAQAQLEQKDLSFFRHNNADRQSKITELESEKRALSRQLQTAQARISDMESQASLKQKDESFFRHGQNEQQAKILDLQSEKRSLTSQLSESLEKVKSLEEKLQSHILKRPSNDQHELEARVLELEVDKRSLTTRLSDALYRLQEMDDQLASRRESAIPKHVMADTRKESSVLNRETSYKIEIARLEEKVADLREQLRNSSGPNTPAKAAAPIFSATPNEIGDLRRQLDEARKQSRDYRDQIEELEKKARKASAGFEKASYDRDDELWQLRRDLEKKTHDLHAGQIELDKIREAVDKSSSKFRIRIQELEQELRQARLTTIEDDTMAMERQDLHEMLKSAKLEAEDLRVQLNDHVALVNASADREKTLRSTMQRIRDERAEQQHRATALSKELAKLQDRYDEKIEELYQRGTETTGPQPKDKKTTAEMKGLAKQIEWLKQNLSREKTFREALAYEKHYYLQQIDMYNACNAVDVQLLKQMGCYTKAPKNSKNRSLRPVAKAIVAIIRMRNMSSGWAGEKKHHNEYLKKVDQARGKKRSLGSKR